MRLVSVVIPCHNSTSFLEETLASVRAQTYPAVETILVNDGTDDPRDLQLLRALGATVNRYIEQPHLGVSAARNTAFRAATADYVVPLDADDRLYPTYIAECLAAMEAHPEASFVYTHYRNFGDVRYTERLPEYNLFDSLYQNAVTPSAVLIAKRAWEQAGGYDESMTIGYEDWDFWLRLADHDCFGLRLPRVLFHYRRRRGSMFTIARTHHDELVKQIRANHPRLYSPEGLARIKARWSPAACLVTGAAGHQQSIEDVQVVPPAGPRQLAAASNANAFLIPTPEQQIDPRSAELCALAVWAGRDSVRLPDGSVSVSRRSLLRANDPRAVDRPRLASYLERTYRHLINAELLSIDSWVKHPLGSAKRLIPLRAKQFVNRFHPVFDLSFYLKFQPQALVIADQLIVPLRYCPRSASGRRRIALITPCLRTGRAEEILLDIAESIDRAQFEIFLIATQSADPRSHETWNVAADHIYDLGAIISQERMAGAIYSLAANWKFDALVIQNSPPACAAIESIRRNQPAVKVIEIGATRSAAAHIDVRIANSEAERRRLLDAGIADEHIRLIREGINLEKFQPMPPHSDDEPSVVLFAGHMNSATPPAMLVKIPRELKKLQPKWDVGFLVAGDGPDPRPLLAESDVVVFLQKSEGIRRNILEAFAMQRPVVCSRVDTLDEVVKPDTGILIETGSGEARRFAIAIESLLIDPLRRRAMGEAGRRLVERDYDRAQSRPRYQELFSPRAAAQVARSS